MSAEGRALDPIAVVGMACRLPLGIESPDELWEAFAHGRDAFTRFDESHRAAAFSKTWGKRRATDFTVGAALLDRVDDFDAGFFQISNREARRVDPQQRQLLEECWHALEHAAIAPPRLRGTPTGVFVGLASDDYSFSTFDASHAELADIHSGTGTHRSMAAGRIAHFFGLAGPAVQLDTACSSSLVAVHLACQSLRLGECELALAAGAQLILDPRAVIVRGLLQALSPDGRCKPFSEDANGFGMGEGIVVFVLKTLERALADRDPVVAVLRGSAMNHNGPGAGLTVPNPQAQAEVIRSALGAAGVDPGTVGYLETHGTGTSLGDPIELDAACRAYGERRQPLLVGSAKSNFGHLEAAAGGLSLMKAVLTVEHGVVPPTLHAEHLNPEIDWSRAPVRVVRQASAWPQIPGPRRAGVSSFGMSGSNCHVVVEQAKQITRASDEAVSSDEPRLCVLTAKSPASLRALADRYARWLEHESPDLSDLAYTLAHGRACLETRAAFVVGNRAELQAACRAVAQGRVWAGVQLGSAPPGGRAWRGVLVLEQPSELATTRLTRLAACPGPLQDAYRRAAAVPASVLDRSDAVVLAAATVFVLGRWLDNLQIVPADAFAARVLDVLLELDPQLVRPTQASDDSIRIELFGAHVRVDSQAACAVPESPKDLLELAARFHVQGATLRWEHLLNGAHRRLRAPLYAFERQSLWLDTNEMPFGREGRAPQAVSSPKTITPEQTMSDSPNNSQLESKSVEAALVELIAEVLETEPARIQVEEPLLQQGADSLTLAEVVGFLDRRFGVHLALRQLFEELLSIRAIADFVSEQPESKALAASPSAARPGSASEPPSPTPAHATIALEVRKLVAGVLEVPEQHLETNKPLLEAGADSLTLAEVVRFVDERFGVHIPLRRLFEELRDIDAIATHVGEITADAPKAAQAVPMGEVLANAERSALRAIGAAPNPAEAVPEASVQTARPGPRPTNGFGGKAWSALASAHPADPEPVRGPREHSHATRNSNSSGERELTPLQREGTERVIARLFERTRGSAEQAARSRTRLCNNRRTLSELRTETQRISYPLRARRSAGAHFEDIDGNDYVDLSMGYGAHLFGHSPPFVVDALQRQLALGMHLGPESDLASEVADGIAELTGHERVLFCNTGTEAVMTAMRIARAASGKNKLVLFRNAYHGHFDGTLANPRSGRDPMGHPQCVGIPEGFVADLLILPFDSPRSLELIAARAEEIGGVLVEPVQNRRPDVHPEEFLRSLRDVTRRHDIPLIFDEILIGFRVHPQGGQGYFGVQADLATYAKVIGGGMPIGVVAGRASIMNRVDGGFSLPLPGDPPPVETIYTAGTYCKHPLSMAASLAVLRELSRVGPALQEGLNRRTDALRDAFNDKMRACGAPLTLHNFGSFFRFAHNGNLSFVYQPLDMDLFNAAMVSRGVYIVEGGTCFLSTEHTDADIEQVLEAAVRSTEELQQCGFLGASGDRATPVGANGAVSSRARSATSATPASRRTQSTRRAEFSLSFFGAYANDAAETPYDLILKASRRADELGFSALWFPERHFHEFGGLSPNPSLLAAAVSQETERISLRAGSVVAALHHPVRIAEEWAVVDRLSAGRVGIAFASGWHADDFVFAPDAFDDRRGVMDRNIATVRALWRGETVALPGSGGRVVETRLFPRPAQAELPIWLASLESKATFEKAGTIGAGVLTNLILQDVDQLSEKISAYRAALARAGHPPESGRVAVLVHTFVGDDDDAARALATEPLKKYLQSSVDLATRMLRQDRAAAVNDLSEEDRRFLFEHSVNRYIEHNALIGSAESCQRFAARLVEAGADEIVCFVDFGIDAEAVLEGLDRLDGVRQQVRDAVPLASAPERSKPPASASQRPGLSIPTTPNQKALLQASHFGQSPAYQIRTTLELSAAFDLEALERALERVVHRHEALRASFPDEDGDTQYLAPEMPVQLQVVDLRALPEAARRQETDRWFEQDSGIALDLERGPVFRFAVLRLGPAEELLVCTAHHAILDGISEQVLIRDIARCYEVELGKGDGELPLPASYVEACERSARAPHAQSMAFFRERLKDFKPLKLPTDRPPPQLQTISGARLHSTIAPQLRVELRRMAAESLTTPFVLLLSAYSALLHEVCDQDDLLVGISMNDRAHVEHDSLICNCSNMVPLRSRLPESSRFIEHLRDTRQSVLEAFEHGQVPYALLVDAFGHRNWSGPPLVATCFNWDHVDPPTFGAVRAALRPDPTTTTRFPLSLNVSESAGEWHLEWDYNTDLFDKRTIATFDARFTALLDEIQRTDADVTLRCKSSVTLLLDRIAAHCQNSGAKVAVTGEGQALSYADLDARSNALAAQLIEQGVRKGDIAAVCLPSKTASIVALLAAWKVGAAFAPLDASAPAAWLDEQLRQTGARAWVTTRATPARGNGARRIVLDRLEDLEPALAPPTVIVNSNDLAYVICTSGTTGEPKHVAVEHGNLAAYVDAINERFEWDGSGCFSMVSPLHVDLGYTMLFPALVGGGKLCVADADVARDPAKLAELMQREACDYLKITPTHLGALLEHDQARALLPRRMLVLGGEPLSWALVGRVRALAPSLRIVNHYGPTETTVGVVTYEIARHEERGDSPSVPIGTPLKHASVSIVATDGSELTTGERGEIVVRGAAVARGYLREEGQETAFVSPGEPGLREYRTGDVACRLPGGALLFCGRRDSQVKVRGFRVDLEAVRATVLEHSAVSDACLTLNDDHSSLTCWAVGRSDRPDTKALAEHLARHLPPTMQPNRIIWTGELPLAVSGKLDRAKLEQLAHGQPEAVTPESSLAIERMLALWREVLQRDDLKPEDNFFEIGETSIAAIKLIARIRRAYGAEIGIRALFENPTPAAVMSFIEGKAPRRQIGLSAAS